MLRVGSLNKTIVVVDYGIVNLKNVVRAITFVGGNVISSSDPVKVASAARLVLPGVGAFGSGMVELKASGLDEAVMTAALTGTPLLAICLGMQMLFTTSIEHGYHDGLNLIQGEVVPIPASRNGYERKVPHIGWNKLVCSPNVSNWEGSYLRDTKEGSYCYFVHSYMAVPNNEDYVVANCNYEGIDIPAVIKKENITGFQCHPERSGSVGLNILKRFVNSNT